MLSGGQRLAAGNQHSKTMTRTSDALPSLVGAGTTGIPVLPLEESCPSIHPHADLLLSFLSSSLFHFFQRCQGPDQPPRPEPQELGPLNGDTATAVHLCASEEVEQDQKAITRILQQHEEDKKKWAQQVEKERELELGEKLDEQRRVLEGEHKEALRVLQASYEQEKEALSHSFQEAKAALQETIDGLTAQLEVFQAKMKRAEESILSRDYKKHIQDYGSPSQFWEQELESLHFVIEMKNERIHELDKRLIIMETVKEKNLLLEEKITALQQEYEDLHARGRNQMAVSRQLSEDLLITREALEKETQLRRQLQQKKEELLYRVLGADTSPAFPLASVTPTEVSFLAT
ncbi:Coiled-coil domain-containing protein 69 [Camelus dromedarius]|uniref:Coiled-coil domain-containing protein 69 n=1 Tax=Camelus dromedarius TaxID=9838 RepID=A0A5N4EEM2_CAMDR|nr:Coiled-coil domain-containing protein 69 [Camelus dromedarius]